MATRGRALPAFYGSECGAAPRRGERGDPRFGQCIAAARCARRHVRRFLAGVLRASVRSLSGVDALAFARWFDERVGPLVVGCGTSVVARYMSEREPNNFAALPVRGDAVFVWFMRFPDVLAERAFGQALAVQSGWHDDCPAEILPALMRKSEVLRLVALAG
jgi:hypothetical protein